MSSSSISLASIPPWVFGLRPQYKYENKNWRYVLASLLLGDFSVIEKGNKTIESERGLGLPSCWYWYIGNANEAFGHVISFWQATTSEWAEDEKGLSPFDSGGLWHNHIATSPPLDDNVKKITFFKKHDQHLRSWHEKIHSYIVRNYDSHSDYIDSHNAPKHGTQGIINAPPNDGQAWTWEAHVDINSIDGKIDISKVFITSSDRDNFLEWIEESREFQSPIKIRLTKWMMSEGCVACPLESTPYGVARQNLIKLFA